VLSLGSNLGDRLAYLQLGLDVLGSGGLDLHAVSSVYETDPVGGVDQADYLNAVLWPAARFRPATSWPGARPLNPRRAG
jgi:2-amino-4-hydroxy-6-hydroxymethyldihydropteridine diphosphokinase